MIDPGCALIQIIDKASKENRCMSSHTMSEYIIEELGELALEIVAIPTSDEEGKEYDRRLNGTASLLFDRASEFYECIPIAERPLEKPCENIAYDIMEIITAND